LCQKFEERGLPNFPSGIPFLFWEQYLGLRQSLGLALLCALVAVFLVMAVLLLNLWAATLVVLALTAMVMQLLGVIGILGIKLSAIPAVLLIVAVGIGVHFIVHICLVSKQWKYQHIDMTFFFQVICAHYLLLLRIFKTRNLR
jgi:patched 1 protein